MFLNTRKYGRLFETNAKMLCIFFALSQIARLTLYLTLAKRERKMKTEILIFLDFASFCFWNLLKC